MSAREELAALIHKAHCYDQANCAGPDNPSRNAADAILAAGWVKPEPDQSHFRLRANLACLTCDEIRETT